MPRGYTVAASALALGVSTKWVDNVLSHNRVVGASQQRQGVARNLTFESLIVLSIALALIRDLHLPTPHALELATQLARNGRYDSPHRIRIEFDTSLIRSDMSVRLANAVEVAPMPTRGRPPGSRTGRLD